MQSVYLLVILIAQFAFILGQTNKFEYGCDILQKIDSLEKQDEATKIQAAAAKLNLEETEKRLNETANQLEVAENRIEAKRIRLDEAGNRMMVAENSLNGADNRIEAIENILKASEKQLQEQQELITIMAEQIAELSIRCLLPWLKYKESCYLFGVGRYFTFYEAEEFCQKHGGHLPYIEDAEENAFLQNYLLKRKYNNFWIGVTDEAKEGTWIRYGTTDKITYFNWDPLQPDNGLGDENCVDLNASYKYYWNDSACSEKYEVLCEV